MLLPGGSTMQYAASYIPVATPDSHRVSTTNTSLPGYTSPSSASSPRSQEAPVRLINDPIIQSSNHLAHRDELTPPSSISSSQEHDISRQKLELEVHKNGRKRTSTGQIKDFVRGEDYNNALEHPTSLCLVSESDTTNLTEISQSLKTKLTYAMIKVQHGWQLNTLDEVESLASQSPRSAVFSNNRTDHTTKLTDHTTKLSPRTALARSVFEGAKSSNRPSASDSYEQPIPCDFTEVTPNIYSNRKMLDPAASIVSASRRRPTPNRHLYINTTKTPQSSRPGTQQRTTSQNAAMEADAVETLLFMSGSPNNSGKFPPTFSPISQAFSTQTSPLKSQFSPTSTQFGRSNHDRSVLIDRILGNLDDDTNEELDQAIRILEQHRASKVML